MSQVFSIWYILELDLFVTCRNNKLVAFVYRLPAPQAVAVDALSIPWDKWSVYCPSTNSVDVASTSQGGSLKSVSNASNGSTSASPAVGSILLSLLVDFQREVPPFPRLLKQPQSGAFQPTRTCSTVYMELSNGFPVFLSQVGCRKLVVSH